MNSKQKGSIAVAQAISRLYLNGNEILLPIGDRMAYDLVYDNGHSLKKVQVKYAGKNSRGKYMAYLRITGGNQSFNYAKKYLDNAFDELFIFTADGRNYLLPWDEVKNRNAITIDNNKYQKYLI